MWLTIEATSPPSVLVSVDGERWAKQGELPTGRPFEGIVSGNGRLVAFRDDPSNGHVVWPPDGSNWIEAEDEGGMDDPEYLHYGGGAFVIVGQDGGIWTSANGARWILQDSGTSATLDSIAYSNGIWVVAGWAAGILIASSIGEEEPDVASVSIDTAIELRWFAEDGVEYQVQSSPDLTTWMDSGAPLVGADSEAKAFRSRSVRERFFRVVSQ